MPNPKIKGPTEKDPIGGDYWRQAVFYKLLVDRSPNGWQVISTEFDFIEPDNKKNYKKEKIYITPGRRSHRYPPDYRNLDKDPEP